MEDLRAKGVAITGAIVLVVAAAFLTLRPKGMQIKLVEQSVVDRKQGPLGSGPGILISLDNLPEGEPSYNDYQMRLWDDQNREIPIMALHLPGANDYLASLGYGHPILRPRLEAWLDGKRISAKVLPPFPAPVAVPLIRTAGSPYRLKRYPSIRTVEMSNLRTTGMTTLFLESPRKQTKDSFEQDKLLRTDRCDSINDEFGRIGAGGFDLPYGDEARMAEVEIQTYRTQTRSEIIRLPPVALILRRGETVASIGRTTKVPNHLDCDLVIPEQPTSDPALSKQDHRSVVVDLSLPALDVMKPAVNKASFSVTMISPRPEKVGLKSLGIGSSGLTARSIVGIPPHTLSIVICLKRTDQILTSSKKVVLAIEESSVKRPNLGVPLLPPSKPPAQSTDEG